MGLPAPRSNEAPAMTAALFVNCLLFIYSPPSSTWSFNPNNVARVHLQIAFSRQLSFLAIFD
jgi:hypothetical protein